MKGKDGYCIVMNVGPAKAWNLNEESEYQYGSSERILLGVLSLAVMR